MLIMMLKMTMAKWFNQLYTTSSLSFFLVRRAKRARLQNDHARDLRNETGEASSGVDARRSRSLEHPLLKLRKTETTHSLSHLSLLSKGFLYPSNKSKPEIHKLLNTFYNVVLYWWIFVPSIPCVPKNVLDDLSWLIVLFDLQHVWEVSKNRGGI